MALLSGIDKSSENLTLISITPLGILIVVLIICIVVALFLFGMYAINQVSVMDEKKRYYRNLNKKLKEKEE